MSEKRDDVGGSCFDPEALRSLAQCQDGGAVKPATDNAPEIGYDETSQERDRLKDPALRRVYLVEELLRIQVKEACKDEPEN